MNARTHVLGIGAILLLIMLVFMPIGVGATPGLDQSSPGMILQDLPTEPSQDLPTGPATEPAQEATTELVEEPIIDPTTGPLIDPTADPTVAPPTTEPTAPPTVAVPTDQPTLEPTIGDPTAVPTNEPTAEPTVVTPTDEPDQELSSFFITKLFCATIDETADDPCLGRVEAAEGSTVYFEVTHLDTGYTDTYPVEIGEFEGYTVGGLLLYDALLGAYQVTEIVPAGYDAFAVPLHDGQTADGASVTIVVGPVEEEEEAFFVNVPVGQEPPATVPPGTTTPATEVPDVLPPDVTPDAEAPVETNPDTATVAALPDTGAGPASGPPAWLAGMELGLIALLLATAAGLRRRGRG